MVHPEPARERRVHRERVARERRRAAHGALRRGRVRGALARGRVAPLGVGERGGRHDGGGIARKSGPWR